MELFHESKNRYFSLILKILNLCSEGLSEEDIRLIIDEGEYEEKVIGKDFKTFEESEVIRRILSIGPHVKVIEPIRIRENIMDIVKKHWKYN